jgi:metal-sulfur cluster biosynthetic enzyme
MPAVDAVVAALRTVLDPEIGIDVVALGLVYDLAIHDGDVALRLGVTAPTCPLSGYLADAAQRAIARVPGVGRVTVTIADAPPWDPVMMSDEARRLLG